MFDISKLVLGEVAKVEELSGQSISEMGENSTPKGKMTAALAFVIRRREDPAFTWNEALGLTMEEASAIIGLNDEPEEPADPTPAAPPAK